MPHGPDSRSAINLRQPLTLSERINGVSSGESFTGARGGVGPEQRSVDEAQLGVNAARGERRAAVEENTQ